jgi:hypothetical protein
MCIRLPASMRYSPVATIPWYSAGSFPAMAYPFHETGRNRFRTIPHRRGGVNPLDSPPPWFIIVRSFDPVGVVPKEGGPVSKPIRKNVAGGNTRREFAKALALAAAAPLVARAPTAAADEPAQPAKPQGPAAVAEALTEVARLQYGKHLSDDQLQAVRRSITGGVFNAERINKVPLKNGDEPACVFSADVP